MLFVDVRSFTTLSETLDPASLARRLNVFYRVATVNIAARLQGAAAPGELLIAQATYEAVKDRFPDAPARQLDLKGKTELVTARVLIAG